MESTPQPVIPEYINAKAEPPPGFVAFAPPTNGNGNGNGYPRPRSPVYADMPPTTSTSAWSSRDSAPVTPRQIYGVPFSGAGPGLGLGRPVVPSPPRDRHISGMDHRSVPLGGGGGATPATRARDLPSSFSVGGGGGGVGTMRGVPSNGSMSYMLREDEGEGEATRRSTFGNANADMDVLPIPPPSFQKMRQ
jgi:hypothetical protein